MKKLSKAIILSMALITGAGALGLANTASARPWHQRCWVGPRGHGCYWVHRYPRRFYRRHWCRWHYCGPVYYGPRVYGPAIVIHPPVVSVW